MVPQRQDTNEPLLAPSEETSHLGVLHLKRFWQKAQARKLGTLAHDAMQDEWNADVTLLSALGLGIEQTYIYLYQSSESLEDFERWIIATRGAPIEPSVIEKYNQSILTSQSAAQDSLPTERVLSQADLDFWQENGYVIIRKAITPEACASAESAVWEHLGLDRNDPSTWYRAHPNRQGIMIQLFQHPALEATRRSERVRRAYAELWGTEELWVSTDRVSFNPPETNEWKFPGPRLHWDVSLELPIPFGLQGVLYLTDTEEEQGALTVVPGFQHRIEAWIGGLPAGSDPRREDDYAFGAKGIAANAGDFIIWHQALPHGSRPNKRDRPRIVQYVNWQPIDPKIQSRWK